MKVSLTKEEFNLLLTSLQDSITENKKEAKAVWTARPRRTISQLIKEQEQLREKLINERRNNTTE